MRKTSLNSNMKHIYKNSLKIFTVYIQCYKLFIEISLYSLSTFNKLLKVYIYKKNILTWWSLWFSRVNLQWRKEAVNLLKSLTLSLYSTYFVRVYKMLDTKGHTAKELTHTETEIKQDQNHIYQMATNG